MPYGTVNADVIGTSVAGSNLGAGDASLMKNRIINGAMVISQRNGTSSITQDATGTQYSLDRFVLYGTVAGKFTAQQNAGSVTPPVGFTNYLGCTSTSAYSVGASDQYLVCQKIEGYNIADLQWGTANAKTVTVSFWAYSSLTGTFSGSLRNGASTFYSYPFTYSIPTANTWTQISVTIAGSTSGTWASTNSSGIEIYFNLGAGSSNTATAGAWTTGSYTGANSSVSVVGTNGATFYITGVQLEVGSSATGFEYRQYTTELQLAQRYYVNILSGSNNFVRGELVGQAYDNTNLIVCVQLPVTLRTAAPTIYSVYGTQYFRTQVNGLTYYISNAISYDILGAQCLTINATITTSMTPGYAMLLSTNNAAAVLAVSAEL